MCLVSQSLVDISQAYQNLLFIKKFIKEVFLFIFSVHAHLRLHSSGEGGKVFMDEIVKK